MIDIIEYGRVQPTEQNALEALAHLLGPELAEAAWSAAVERAGLSRPVSALTDLQRVAEELTRLGDQIARIAGRSLRIRVISYRALEQWTLPEPGEPSGSGGAAGSPATAGRREAPGRRERVSG